MLDDDSPFVAMFRELGLERVCDADWLRFVPATSCSVLVAAAGGNAGRGGVGEGGAGGQVLPFAALVTRP